MGDVTSDDVQGLIEMMIYRSVCSLMCPSVSVGHNIQTMKTTIEQ